MLQHSHSGTKSSTSGNAETAGLDREECESAGRCVGGRASFSVSRCSTEDLIGPRQQPGEVELVGAGLPGGFEVGAGPVARGVGKLGSRAAVPRRDSRDGRDK